MVASWVVMNEITEILTDFRSMDRKSFLAKHFHPVLLHQTNPGDSQSTGGFVTGLDQVKRRGTVVADHPYTQTARSETGLLVFPVKALVEAIGPAEVTVGRDHSCDVQLPYDTVSKLHARFTRGQGRTWLITDEGTTNGTYMDDARLIPHEAYDVPSGTRLKFATATLTFYLAGDFHDHLMKLLRSAGGR